MTETKLIFLDLSDDSLSSVCSESSKKLALTNDLDFGIKLLGNIPYTGYHPIHKAPHHLSNFSVVLARHHILIEKLECMCYLYHLL